MKSIRLDLLPSYSKLQLAEHQLERAVRLLLDEEDTISAITLAGAAEEILGKLVELRGGAHSLQKFIEECVEGGKQRGEEWKGSDFADMANYFRNELKHYSDGQDVTVTPNLAYDLIDRAVENLLALGVEEFEQLRRYRSARHWPY